MVFRMLAVLSEFERDLVAERTRGALAYKRDRNEKTGGPVPFGYALAEDGVHLVPCPVEQDVIALVLELRAAGQAYRSIAAELERRGIPTRCGGRWYAATVRNIYRRGVAA